MPNDRDEQLNLLPELLVDPDRRRARENARRLEENVRKQIAAATKAAGSYYRRFLVDD